MIPAVRFDFASISAVGRPMRVVRFGTGRSAAIPGVRVPMLIFEPPPSDTAEQIGLQRPGRRRSVISVLNSSDEQCNVLGRLSIHYLGINGERIRVVTQNAPKDNASILGGRVAR